MDYLWTPWRFTYVSEPDTSPRCVFCRTPEETQDERTYIVHRARNNYLILNLYPYTVGHLMIVPYRHIDTLEQGEAEELREMMELARRAESALRKVYRPQGINLGMNIGKSAGAGVAGHIHMHVLPRWEADANFFSVVGETRVLPEELAVTWRKLRREFSGENAGSR